MITLLIFLYVSKNLSYANSNLAFADKVQFEDGADNQAIQLTTPPNVSACGIGAAPVEKPIHKKS